NTIVALERAGKTLERVQAIYGIYTSTLNDDAAQAVVIAVGKFEVCFDPLPAFGGHSIRGRLQLLPDQPVEKRLSHAL
ncbi:hypothetical protein, partial [Klebsiella pneumoniae]|uniref:hypothetical protein n=1 Tax=Klebsiella pneumoniae TaxID=573 RepID=UPI001E33DCB9